MWELLWNNVSKYWLTGVEKIFIVSIKKIFSKKKMTFMKLKKILVRKKSKEKPTKFVLNENFIHSWVFKKNLKKFHKIPWKVKMRTCLKNCLKNQNLRYISFSFLSQQNNQRQDFPCEIDFPKVSWINFSSFNFLITKSEQSSRISRVFVSD